MHFHLLFLEGVYTTTPWGKRRFHRTNAPTQQALTERVHTISHRVAIGPQQGRKVFMLQTIPAWEEDDRFAQVAKVAGFSLHAGVAAQAWERQKLERLCRYVSRPAVSEKRLSLTPSGNIRYQLKTPYSDGTWKRVDLAGNPGC